MMKQKTILFIGSYGLGRQAMGGQDTKIRNTYGLFEKYYKQGNVMLFDTETVRKRPYMIIRLFFMLFRANIVVPSLATNGLQVIFPMVYYLGKLLRYNVIFLGFGGWHYEFFMGNDHGDPQFSPHLHIMKMAKNIKCFMVENSHVYEKLKNKCGFKNLDIFPNFRIYDFNLDKFNDTKTLKLVYGARVDRDKGYESLFSLAKRIESEKLDIIIDIYGHIAEKDKEHFGLQIENSNKTIINYKGALIANNIYETYSHYDIMLFPTHYPGEGFAGTILDSYIAGIPVIATDWRHNKDYVINGVTGFVLPMDNFDKLLQEKIIELYNDRKKLFCLKKNAHKERLKYDEMTVWNTIQKYLH